MQFPLLPDYGVYLWWPQAGHSWIHPDDVALANHLIPGERVFRRERYDGLHYHLRHGDQTLRVRPTIWLPVKYEGVDVGDRVEVLAEGIEREAFVAVVDAMHYYRPKKQIEYHLRRRGQLLPRRYLVTELRAIKQPLLSSPQVGIAP